MSLFFMNIAVISFQVLLLSYSWFYDIGNSNKATKSPFENNPFGKKMICVMKNKISGKKNRAFLTSAKYLAAIPVYGMTMLEQTPTWSTSLEY